MCCSVACAEGNGTKQHHLASVQDKEKPQTPETEFSAAGGIEGMKQLKGICFLVEKVVVVSFPPYFRSFL